MTSTFRGRLFRHYAIYLAVLLSFALLVSGSVSLYFAYMDTRALVDEVQREKARGAALRIEQFVKAIEDQARAALPLMQAGEADHEQRELDLLKLLRLVPAITDAAWIDANQRERLSVSRVSRDLVNIDVDRSSHPAMQAAAARKVWYGPVYFRRESAPYLTLAVPGLHRVMGTVVVEVNLTFVGEVLSTIRVGKTGHAYVVDREGRLISHPDLSQVLRQTDLSNLKQVQTALAALPSDESRPTVIARSEHGAQAITAYARIEPLGWNVLVEQPLSEAFAPIYGHAQRGLLILLGGVLLAIGASVLLARGLVKPIRALEAGVRRIAEGDLQHTAAVHTGDELEDLATQFNLMAHSLRESYASMEEKIAERTQELAQANSAKSLFFAAASHDLRQPVHALGLYIAQLEDASAGGPHEQLIRKISESEAALSDLLDALLDISQLDAGAIDPRPAPFDVAPLFARIEHAIAPAARAKELRLRVRPPTADAFTDPVLLERILLNLASNAVRYTQAGGVLIATRRRGKRLQIEVWDTGPGIAPDQQHRIFEEFYRLAPHAADDRSKGLGLGLAIVARLVRLLGLELSVRSVPGQGSKFSISVPLAQAGRGPAATISPLVLPITFDAPLILLIDDDPAAREAAGGLLRRWGCRVLTAASRAEAEAALSCTGETPAAIVSDYRLEGDCCGTDVVAAIRAEWGSVIPAILVTGDVTVNLQAEAQRAAMHLLQKPLKPAKLRVVLQHILSAHNEQPQSSVRAGALGSGRREEVVGMQS